MVMMLAPSKQLLKEDAAEAAVKDPDGAPDAEVEEAPTAEAEEPATTS